MTLRSYPPPPKNEPTTQEKSRRPMDGFFLVWRARRPFRKASARVTLHGAQRPQRHPRNYVRCAVKRGILRSVAAACRH